jgi:hypothetical protein
MQKINHIIMPQLTTNKKEESFKKLPCTVLTKAIKYLGTNLRKYVQESYIKVRKYNQRVKRYF